MYRKMETRDIAQFVQAFPHDNILSCSSSSKGKGMELILKRAPFGNAKKCFLKKAPDREEFTFLGDVHVRKFSFL